MPIYASCAGEGLPTKTIFGRPRLFEMGPFSSFRQRRGSHHSGIRAPWPHTIPLCADQTGAETFSRHAKSPTPSSRSPVRFSEINEDFMALASWHPNGGPAGEARPPGWSSILADGVGSREPRELASRAGRDSGAPRCCRPRSPMPPTGSLQRAMFDAARGQFTTPRWRAPSEGQMATTLHGLAFPRECPPRRPCGRLPHLSRSARARSAG